MTGLECRIGDWLIFDGGTGILPVAEKGACPLAGGLALNPITGVFLATNRPVIDSAPRHRITAP